MSQFTYFELLQKKDQYFEKMYDPNINIEMFKYYQKQIARIDLELSKR